MRGEDLPPALTGKVTEDYATNVPGNGRAFDSRIEHRGSAVLLWKPGSRGSQL